MALEKYFDWEAIELLQGEQVAQLKKVEHKYKEENKTASFYDYFSHFLEESAELTLAVLKRKPINEIREEIADVSNMCNYMYQQTFKDFPKESEE